IVRVYEVADRVANGTVVANAAGEDVVDSGAYAFHHHAALQHALLHGGPDAPGTIDGVDRAHVVAMTAGHGRSGLEVHPERGAEERQLRIVHGERIAGEEHVDVSTSNQLREIGRATRVHDHRSDDEREPASARLRIAHHPRDSRDAHFDAPFRRHVVRHEREIRAIAIAELGRDAEPFEPAHDPTAGTHVAHLPALDAATLAYDHGVHALARDIDPAPVDARPRSR